MSKIDPDYGPHADLIRKVRMVVESLGGAFYELKQYDRKLHSEYTIVSLRRRIEPDAKAVFKSFDLAFDIECKTHDSQEEHDLTLEALQLINNIEAQERCLYCCWNPTTEIEGGFWAKKHPPIREGKFPSRKEYEPIRVELMQLVYRMLAPKKGSSVMRRSTKNGSNDPFVVVDRKDFEALPRWEKLIEEVVREAKAQRRIWEDS